MTFEEYFGEWSTIIDKKILYKAINSLNRINPSLLCPRYEDIFRCFKYCKLSDIKVVILGLSPYPQEGIATGIAFGNNKETLEDNLSPSLKIIKESIINLDIPHNSINFDPSLEEWERQGVLMLNSALTCLKGLPNSHLALWRPFISSIIYNLSRYMTGCIYVLFGEEAKTFEPYIYEHNYIIKEKHPSYYARTNQRLSSNMWIQINNILKNNKIHWYEESNFEKL